MEEGGRISLQAVVPAGRHTRNSSCLPVATAAATDRFVLLGLWQELVGGSSCCMRMPPKVTLSAEAHPSFFMSSLVPSCSVLGRRQAYQLPFQAVLNSGCRVSDEEEREVGKQVGHKGSHTGIVVCRHC